MVRMSAEERRESVIRAAMSEFARGGYNGTSTETIARRVGVSQPYLFRLFPNKEAMFLAAATYCLESTRQVFADVAEHETDYEGKLKAMGNAYRTLISDDPERLLMQMQMYVAVAAAEASGDHEFGRSIREGWEVLWETLHLELGADVEQTTQFLAYGMLINTLVSLGFPADHRIWEGLYETAHPE
ncbi:TetR family transcriptional regulator [Streptomyces sp. NPDC008139]|uniref:TetR/AcrR family transcriptional regulator n=1 Tax=Streptomyces sp. NPDC008139 TaxID=3364814 RepID=UPI0036E619D3